MTRMVTSVTPMRMKMEFDIIWSDSSIYTIEGVYTLVDDYDSGKVSDKDISELCEIEYNSDMYVKDIYPVTV